MPEKKHAPQPYAMTAVSWIEWAASYGMGAVVGIAGAVHSIHQKFYDDVKSWKVIRELRSERDAKLQAIEGTAANPKTFRAFHVQAKEIEREYSKELNHRLKYVCGIETGGIKGLTVGTWQRWLSSGPHTRRAAAFSLMTGAAVSIGAILTIKNRRLIAELGDRSERETRSGHSI